jgi:hypothetical protein
MRKNAGFGIVVLGILASAFRSRQHHRPQCACNRRSSQHARHHADFRREGESIGGTDASGLQHHLREHNVGSTTKLGEENTIQGNYIGGTGITGSVALVELRGNYHLQQTRPPTRIGGDEPHARSPARNVHLGETTMASSWEANTAPFDQGETSSERMRQRPRRSPTHGGHPPGTEVGDTRGRRAAAGDRN